MTLSSVIIRTVICVGLIAIVPSSQTNLTETEQVCFDVVAFNRLFNQISTLSVKSGSPAWPPTDPKNFYDEATKNYELDLHLLSLPKEKLPDVQSMWLSRLRQYYQVDRPLTGSPFKQMVIMLNALSPTITNKTEFDLYPPIINVYEDVKEVKSGQPADHAPVDDPSIDVIKYPITGQPGSTMKYDLVVIVSSCVDCIVHREWARKTYMEPNLWGSFKVGFIFLVGMPASKPVRIFEAPGVRIQQQPSYSKKMGRDLITKSLLTEADKFKDMLIGDFEDEFFNSTLRAIMGFRWATFFLSQQTPLFLFLDTEYSIIPSNVIKFVNQLPANSKPLFYGGIVNEAKLVVRAPNNSVTTLRWAVSEDEIPWERYPPYARRMAIFVGSQAVIDATIGMAFTNRFRIYDVYLGIVFYRLHYKPVHIPNLKLAVDTCSVPDAIGGYTGDLVPLIDWSTGQVKVG